MKNKIIRLAFITVLLLIIPALGNRFVEGWNWSPFDFVWAGTLIFVTGLAYQLIARKADSLARNASVYRVATGISLATAFALVWVNAAVGIIGEDNGSNLMYFAALLIGFVMAVVGRLEPRAIAHALFVTAFVTFFIPIVVLIVMPGEIYNTPPGLIKVFILNTFFVAMFIGSGLLFRKVTSK
jgi:hypothetical protein